MWKLVTVPKSASMHDFAIFRNHRFCADGVDECCMGVEHL